MKDCRTITIKQILEEIKQEKRNDIIYTFNSAMRSICAGDLEWQNFEVFLPGIELMKIILESNSPEYLLAIADKLLRNDEIMKVVKLIVKRDSKPDFDTNKYKETVIATIIISNNDLGKMVKEI